MYTVRLSNGRYVQFESGPSKIQEWGKSQDRGKSIKRWNAKDQLAFHWLWYPEKYTELELDEAIELLWQGNGTYRNITQIYVENLDA